MLDVSGTHTVHFYLKAVAAALMFQGQTPLHLAAQGKQVLAMRVLLGVGAQASTTDSAVSLRVCYSPLQPLTQLIHVVETT